MNKSHLIWGVGGLLVGIVIAGRARTLPLLNKLPSA